MIFTKKHNNVFSIKLKKLIKHYIFNNYLFFFFNLFIFLLIYKDLNESYIVKTKTEKCCWFDLKKSFIVLRDSFVNTVRFSGSFEFILC